MKKFMATVLGIALVWTSSLVLVSVLNLNVHATQIVKPPGGAWRSNSVQLAVDIQSHLNGIAPLFSSLTSPGLSQSTFHLDSSVLVSTLHDRITAFGATPNQIFAGVALIHALSQPERLATVREYIESAGVPDSSVSQRVIDGMEKWSSALQKNPKAKEALANAVEPLQRMLLSGGNFDKETLEFHIKALFDGTLVRKGGTILAEGPVTFGGEVTKPISASARLMPYDPQAVPEQTLFKEIPSPGKSPGYTLSNSNKRAILTYLTHNVHATPEQDEYWDKYSRYQESRDAPEEKKGGKPAGRQWFFPDREIGQETAEFVDIDALGFGHEFKGATRYRVRKLLAAPLTHVEELRERQGAILELISPDSQLLDKLTSILNRTETREWKRTFFYDERDRHPETAQVFNRSPAEAEVHTKLRSRQEPNPHWVEYVQKRVEERRQFFRDALEVARVLHNLEVKSIRFQQLGWLLQSIINDSGSDAAGEWIQKVVNTSDLLEHENLIEKVSVGRVSRRFEEEDGAGSRTSDNLNSRVHLFIEAFSELMMYVELAEHSKAHQWMTFPTILDPREIGHPVLSIVNGHSPRVLGNADSIANSIELGFDPTKRHAIITGPNAQGKSTTLRMVGQLLTLAQMGLPVPAQSMKLTPLGLIVYLHPKDNPAIGDSLFMAEARELWQGVYRRAAQNPFQLIIMDEIAPGTIQQVREDFESVVLRALDQTGVISLTATHNLGTTKLGQNANGPFFNLHVAKYHVLQGSNADLGPMYEGAAKALRDVGVPENVIDQFLQLGNRRK